MVSARILYGACSAASLVVWLVAAETGWSPASTAYTLPASVRQSPGGYRSFHFWHSGFQMGK
jgi:hypothetical protein